MAYTDILYDETDGVATITFNRPHRRNAVSLQMMDEIIAAARAAEADPTISAVILTGGQEYFSAGADLNEAREIKGAADGKKYFGAWHHLTTSLEELGRPVIAAIEGFCMTGGCELALACDLRIAGAGASFAITSARIGPVAGAGGTQRLPRLVGPANALEMLFSAEPIDAVRAERIGLINRLVPAGEALAIAKQYAAHYATRAPLSLTFAKRAVHRGLQMDLASGLEFESFLVSTIYGTEDKQEGISAFLEKRPARFKGK